MRKRSGSVGGTGVQSGGVSVAPVSDEALARISDIDYSDQATFEEIRDDVLDAIKHFGDRYDLRQQGRSSTSAMFVLSPDSVAIHQQLVRYFASRPEFSVKVGVPPNSKLLLDAEETVIVYRQAQPAPTFGKKMKKKMPYIVFGSIAFCYLYYIGTV